MSPAATAVRNCATVPGAPVAQSEEQRTFNPRVRRSKLRGGTTDTCLDRLPPRIRLKIVFRDAPADRPVAGQCWIWTGGKTSAGYGLTRFDGKQRYLHRIAYTLCVEEIPAGLHIDHRCRVVDCCNPDHLDAVTPRVNTLRGLKATKRECINGHPLSGHNLVWNNNGPGRPRTRRCRTCFNASHRESRKRHGAKWNAARRAARQAVSA